MLVIHEPLDIPHRTTCPELMDQEDNERVDGFINFIITHAMRDANVVDAEVARVGGQGAPVPWRLRPRSASNQETTLAEMPSSMFRNVLARINVRFLDGQMYGGCVRRVLCQGGVQQIAVIHTGNEQASGFWIRMVTGGPVNR